MSDSFIGEHMVKFPYTVRPGISVKTAAAMMAENRIRHLPVVNDHKVIGIVSDRDLRAYVDLDERAPVESMMTESVYCVRVGTPLEEVVKTLAKKRIGSAVVVSATREVLGIFTTTDALYLLGRMLQNSPPAGVKLWAVEDILEWDELPA